jgi:hypothetical protein
MKKKIFSTLLMGAFFLASMSMFTSCKDYDDDINDLRNLIEKNASTLTQLVDQKINNVNTELAALKSDLAKLDAAYKSADADLKSSLEKAIKDGDDAAKTYAKQQADAAQAAAIAAAKASLDEAVSALESSLAKANAAIEANGKSIAGLIEADKELQKGIDEAKAAAAKAQETADAAKAQAEKNAIELEKTNATIAENQAKLAEDLKAINASIENVKNSLTEEINIIKGRVSEVEQTAAENKANIVSLTTRVNTLEEINAQVQETLKALGEKDAELQRMIEANAEEIKNLKEVTIKDIYEKIAQNADAIKVNSEAIAAIVKDLQDNYWTAETIKQYVKDENDKLNQSLLEAIAKQSEEDLKAAQAMVDALAEQVKLDIAAGVAEAKQYTDDEIVKALETAYNAASELVNTAVENLTEAYTSADELLQNNIDAVQGNLDAVKAELEGKDTELSNRITALEAFVNGFIGQVDEEGKAVTVVEAIAEQINALSAQMTNALNAAVETLEGKYDVMITSVNLFTTVEDHLNQNYDHELTFTAVDEKNASFGKDVTDGEFTFTEGKHVTYGDEVVIRVSPSTATLKPAMISLINSKGVASKLVTVESVEKFDELITRPATRAAASNNGLWVVKFKLSEEYTPEQLAAEFFADEENSIVYAVAVNNINQDAAEAEQRRVVSEYDLTLNAVPGEPANPDFFVYSNLIPEKWRSVAEIHNRYTETELEKISTEEVEELEWNDNLKPAVAPTKDNAGDRVTGYDNRQDKAILPVEIGKDIKIAINAELKDGKPVITAPIKGFYVALDKNFALESSGSEVNAWAKYTYENVTVINRNDKITEKGKLFEGNEGVIKITDLDGVTLGDIIGFRVYAVNLDGTLLDPDGRAFYVRVGEAGVDGVVNVDLLANIKNVLLEYDIRTVDGLVATEYNFGLEELGVKFKSFKSKTHGTASAADITPAPLANNGIYWVLLDEDGNEVSDWADAKSIKVAIAQPKNWIDNETYTFSIDCVDEETGILVNKLTVNVKKTLPTAAPENVQWKTNQLKNGVYTCYLDPQYTLTTPNSGFPTAPVWNAEATEGYKDLVMAMNGLDQYDNYLWTIDNAAGADFSDQLKVSATQNSFLNYDNDYKLTVDAKLIDNTTKHNASLSFLYPGISTPDENNKGLDWGVKVKAGNDKENVDIIFACLVDPSVHKYSYTTASIKYAQTGQTIKFSAIKAANSYDPAHYSYTGFKPALYVDGSITAELISDANKQAEYFDVEVGTDAFKLTPKSGATVPTATVASTLVVKAKCAYGHEMTIMQLPVNVTQK